MLTRLVPAIYERYWRPALGRVVQGGHRARGWPRRCGSPGCCSGSARATRCSTSPAAPATSPAGSRTRSGPAASSVGIDASRDDARARRRGAAPRRPGQPDPDPRRRDRAAVSRRRASTPAAASPRCTCSPTRSPALDEMRRVLAPGGRIALMTSVRRELTAAAAEAGARARQRDADLRGRRDRRRPRAARLHRHPPPALGHGPVRRRTARAARRRRPSSAGALGQAELHRPAR